MKKLTLLFSLLLLVTAARPVTAKPQVVAQYQLPSNPSVNALVSGPDGNVWVVGFESVYRVTPAGAVTTYNAAADGLSICVGPDGAIYFGAVGLGQVGRITTSGDVTYYPIAPPNGSNYLPTVAGITTGPDGNLWISDYANAEIIRLSTNNGAVAYFPISGGGYPYGIITGPDGALWAADRNGQVDRVTVDGTVSVIPIPGSYGVEGITVGGDGNLWVNNHGVGLTRITPAGVVTNFPTGTYNGTQFVTTGPKGQIWFSAWGAYPRDYVGELDPVTGRFSVALASGSGAYGLTLGPDGRSVWFAEAFTNSVGVARP